MQSVQIHNGFFVVLERGEEVIETLRRFSEENDVHWATFHAIGAVEDVEIGYFDLETRSYIFEAEQGPFEVASLDGNISELNEEPLIHAHTVLSRCDGTNACIGGHLRSARVALTLEVSIWEVTQPLLRSPDEETGLNLLRV